MTQRLKPPSPYGELAESVVDGAMSQAQAQASLKATGYVTEEERRRLGRYIQEERDRRAYVRRCFPAIDPRMSLVEAILRGLRRAPSDN